MTNCYYCNSTDIITANSFELTCASCGSVAQEYFPDEKHVAYHYDKKLVPILQALIDKCDVSCDDENFADMCILAQYSTETSLYDKCAFAISYKYNIPIMDLCSFLKIKNNFSVPVLIQNTIVETCSEYGLNNADIQEVKRHYSKYLVNKEVYCSQQELVKCMLKFIFPKLPIAKSKTYKRLYSN